MYDQLQGDTATGQYRVEQDGDRREHDLQIRNSLILFFQIGLKGDDVLLNILIQIVDCRPVQAHSPPYVDILYIRHEEGELLLEIL